MKIDKIVVKNYKRLKDVCFNINTTFNILVGQNDAGKSTILEVLSILTTGKLNGFPFERQLKANLFNQETRNAFRASLSAGEFCNPPSILFEAYCSNGDATYKGTNNSSHEDTIGIRVSVEFNQEYGDTYQRMQQTNEISDIPIEFYSVSYKYFSGESVVYRNCPLKSVLIDATRKDYSYMVDRFVSTSIANYLSQEDQQTLCSTYLRAKREFAHNDIVKRLNDGIQQLSDIGGRKITLGLREESVNEWKRQMSVNVDEIDFENIGFGSQNVLKTKLAIQRLDEKEGVNLILLEEPENSLSFSNLTRMIGSVEKSKEKQIFISTHNSYVANKLRLGNILFVDGGKVKSFGDLDDGTQRYFEKLPGYDTLRLILAEKVVLVEGPTDELIFSRAYQDKFGGRMPADDGIDVITVRGVSFKRYLEIARLMSKMVIMITDNDGNISKNITTKYEEYLKSNDGLVKVSYETDETLKTIEPSVLEVNCRDGVVNENFLDVISKENSLKGRSKDDALQFMSDHKVEWAMRVFVNEKKIAYPRYILDAVEKCS